MNNEAPGSEADNYIRVTVNFQVQNLRIGERTCYHSPPQLPHLPPLHPPPLPPTWMDFVTLQMPLQGTLVEGEAEAGGTIIVGA